MFGVLLQMKKRLLHTKGLTASKKLEKWRRRLEARLKRQRERIAEVQAALDYSMTHGWRNFESLRDVLVQAGKQVMSYLQHAHVLRLLLPSCQCAL